MINRLLSLQVVRYGLTGGISTAIHMLTAFACIRWLQDDLWLSNFVGFIVAYCFSYTVQSIFVFQHSLSLNKAMRFFLVQLTALFISISATELISNVNNYLGVIFVILLLPLITFLIHKFWTFSGLRQDGP